MAAALATKLALRGAIRVAKLGNTSFVSGRFFVIILLPAHFALDGCVLFILAFVCPET